VERPRRTGKKDQIVDSFGDFQPPVETIRDRLKLYRKYHERVKSIIEVSVREEAKLKREV